MFGKLIDKVLTHLFEQQVFQMSDEDVVARGIKLSKKLHVPFSVCRISISLDGKMVEDRVAHSLNRNGWNLMAAQMLVVNLSDNTFGSGKLSYKDTGGAVRYGAGCYTFKYDGFFNSQAADGKGLSINGGNVSAGLIFGTGVGAENFEDNAIGTLIANGTGAGQLLYSWGTIPFFLWDAGTRTLSTRQSRYGDNISGNTITVTEMSAYANDVNTSWDVMIFRDLLGSPIAVDDHKQIKGSYIASLVYPS